MIDFEALWFFVSLAAAARCAAGLRAEPIRYEEWYWGNARQGGD